MFIFRNILMIIKITNILTFLEGVGAEDGGSPRGGI